MKTNQNFPDFTSRQLVSHLHNELSSDKTHFAIKCTPLNDDLIDVLFTGLPRHIESLSIDFDLNIFRSSTNYVFEHVKRLSVPKRGSNFDQSDENATTNRFCSTRGLGAPLPGHIERWMAWIHFKERTFSQIEAETSDWSRNSIRERSIHSRTINGENWLRRCRIWRC